MYPNLNEKLYSKLFRFSQPWNKYLDISIAAVLVPKIPASESQDPFHVYIKINAVFLRARIKAMTTVCASMDNRRACCRELFVSLMIGSDDPCRSIKHHDKRPQPPPSQHSIKSPCPYWLFLGLTPRKASLKPQGPSTVLFFRDEDGTRGLWWIDLCFPHCDLRNLED